MKKQTPILFFILCLCAKMSFAQSDLAYDSIATLNLNLYAAKPVDSLLQKLPQSYSSMKLIGNTRTNKIRGLSIYYSNGMEVWIVPKNYSYMTMIDPGRTWNITLFKKETASDITVMHPDYPSLTGHYP